MCCGSSFDGSRRITFYGIVSAQCRWRKINDKPLLILINTHRAMPFIHFWYVLCLYGRIGHLQKGMAKKEEMVARKTGDMIPTVLWRSGDRNKSFCLRTAANREGISKEHTPTRPFYLRAVRVNKLEPIRILFIMVIQSRSYNNNSVVARGEVDTTVNRGLHISRRTDYSAICIPETGHFGDNFIRKRWN